MSNSIIEKNKRENIDLLQIEYFSDIPISTKEVLVLEPNEPIALTIRKFLLKLGFENTHICKEMNDCLKIFSDFINNEINLPVIIDDAISYGGIRNITKEIFETQPNAKIIIITTRDRKDVHITELLSTGIVSIIQKPLDYQNFKKSISSIFEKNSEGRPNLEENFEELISSSKNVSQNKIQDILKVETSEIETLINEASNKRNVILENEILEAACNQCDSTNITYISECPNCKGINFKQQNLIEHYQCGEVFPKEPNNNTCPKCNRDIGTVGTSYREFSDYYVCNSCNDKFPRPLLRFRCLDCNNFFIENLAAWKKGRIFKTQK